MKLYYSPVTCALSPYIVMLESGLAHELVPVDLKTHTLPDGSDFRAVNPLGYVPFLQTSDGRDQAPERQLAPAHGSFERYQLLSCLNFIATELPKNYDELFSSAASPEAKEKATRALSRRARRTRPAAAPESPSRSPRGALPRSQRLPSLQNSSARTFQGQDDSSGW